MVWPCQSYRNNFAAAWESICLIAGKVRYIVAWMTSKNSSPDIWSYSKCQAKKKP